MPSQYHHLTHPDGGALLFAINVNTLPPAEEVRVAVQQDTQTFKASWPSPGDRAVFLLGETPGGSFALLRGRIDAEDLPGFRPDQA